MSNNNKVKAMKKSVMAGLVAGTVLLVAGVVLAEEKAQEEQASKKEVKVIVNFTEKKAASNLGGFKMGGMCLDEFPGSTMCNAKKGLEDITFSQKSAVEKVWVKPVTINTSGYFTTCYSWEWQKFNTEADKLSVDTLTQTQCDEPLPVACCQTVK